MQKQKLSADDMGMLVLLTAIIFGTWFRMMPALRAGFPINDGGMFYTMIQDLRANHYIPPLYTTYNNLNIPFVYPPLGLYLAAAISDLFNLTTPLAVIQWLPGIINALCIPVFYLFANELLRDKLQGAISTLVYSFIPYTAAWHSMGGGLTRAPGEFFMLLALTYIHRVFTEESQSDVWGAIVFSSLVTLSHTEAPLYTIAIALYIWAMKSRSIKGLLNGVLIAIGVLVLSSPWYGWIIYKHGFTPLISASQTGFHSIGSILRLINIDFVTGEPFLDLLGALSILGMAILITKRNFFVPGVLIIVYLAEPRSAHIIANIPLALAAGVFIVEVLLPAIARIQEQGINNLGPKVRYTWVTFLFVLIPYLFSNAISYGLFISEMHVSKAERDAMQWAANNTPKDSKFLVITGEPNGFCDSTSEWFPALANRQSLGTLQGNEWLKGKAFGEYATQIRNLQACSKKGLDCILQEEVHFHPGFDYLYISTNLPAITCNIKDDPDSTRGLILELENSAHFKNVFRSEEVMIFSKK